MELPTISCLILTYNRREMVLETIRRLQEHLKYSGNIQYVVSDDGSDDGTQAALLEEFPGLALVQNNRVGLGASNNRGLERCWANGDIVLQLQDDLYCQKDLPLDLHVEKLLADETCGFIRLWGVAGHRYQGALEGGYWRVWWNSPELYIPSDRPHIKHGRFHAFFGYYPEGRKTAETEEAFCHQCKDRAGLNGKQLDVFVPVTVDTEGSFEHMAYGSRWRAVGL